MTSNIIKESSVRKGRHIITVLEFDTGEVVMYLSLIHISEPTRPY